MVLVWLILILLIGGLLVCLADRTKLGDPRWLTLATLVTGLLLVASIGFSVGESVAMGNHLWISAVDLPWIPRFGIRFILALDGLSLLMLLLTLFLGIIAVLSSWSEIKERSGFFHFNLLWTLAGVVGVFTAMDLFLFFVFWEVMLIPMYFIIAIWGHENRSYAAIKFFIFTQASGLLMLLAMVALVWVHYGATGQLSFSFFDLVAAERPAEISFWLMLGFFIAFVVKLPGVPLHTWLPDAHTQAPTAGSVILAGVLLKTGAYGLIRFCVPLFPEASMAFAPTAMLLGVISIIYGAVLAFGQTDVKRLIAYTSISHMGFVLLGLYALNLNAYQGVVITMLAHGMTSAALFAFAGALQQRLHTRDMREMGGFWNSAPRMGALVMFFSIAALGMPGLANFIGEFLVLVGAFKSNPWLTAVAALGLILAPLYSLLVVQRIFHGQPLVVRYVEDFSSRELVMMGMMLLVTLGIGLYPQPVLDALLLVGVGD